MSARLYVCSNCSAVYALEREPRFDCRSALMYRSKGLPYTTAKPETCGGSLMPLLFCELPNTLAQQEATP